ncbi:MAG TPA: hypothetical protein VGG19_07125, partial [Tepidisphaeraceae bacterium]
MSDPATAISIAPLIAADSEEPSRSFAAQAWQRTFLPLGAKFGAAWIFLLAFGAIFAPFLASSFPLLVKQNGHWCSPMLRQLTPVDVILLVVTGAAIVCLAMRCSFKRLALVTLVALCIVTPLALLFVRPPANVVFEQYRQFAAEGKFERVIWAPIPFSPGDHLRDQPDLRLTAPSRAHLMGTEINGADVFSRILYACRIALSIGFISTGIAIAIGI